MNKAKILLADDEATLRENLAEVISEDGECDVIACADGTQALKILRSEHVDALITDLRMPGMTGMDLVEQAIAIVPDIAIIVITAFGEVETAVEAMKKGVRDYICKPLVLEDVVFRLKRLLAHNALTKENRLLHEQISENFDPIATVGVSAAIRSVQNRIDELGSSTEYVLITGERGTRKEDIARAIHCAGDRPVKPFVSVNCTESIEGSMRGGTLFLGELTDLSPASQAELLRLIKLGTQNNCKTRSENTRVIGASRHDLATYVREGRFDRNLYQQLGAVQLTVPPLRERTEDIETLTRHFVERFSRELNLPRSEFGRDTFDVLRSYLWPGNLRELETVVGRAVLLTDGMEIDVAHLFLSQASGRGTRLGASDLRSAVREFESNHISNVLASVDGNKIEAAGILEIGLSSLYRKLDDLREVHAYTSEGMAP